MATPLASQLAGLDWAYQGRAFATLHSPGLTQTDPTTWAYQARGFYLLDDASNPAAPRQITSVRASVLAGNPSLAEGQITAVRAMVLRASQVPDAPRQVTATRALVLRSSAQEDSERRVTALRVNLLRTHDVDDAPRRLSSIRLITLRSNRRGDVARPSLHTQVNFSDPNAGAAIQEQHYDGYLTVATQDATAHGSIYSNPTPVPALFPKVPLPVDFSIRGDSAEIVKVMKRIWPDGTIVKTLSEVDLFGTTTYNSTWECNSLPGTNAQGGSNGTGVFMFGDPERNPAIGENGVNGWYTNVPQRNTPAADGSLILDAAGLEQWYDPQPDAYPAVLHSVIAYRTMQRRYTAVGAVPSSGTNNQQIAISSPYSGYIQEGPRLPLIIRPPRGAVRVKAWDPGWLVSTPLLPPFPIPQLDLSSLVGQTFADIREVFELLNSLPAYQKDTLADTLGQGLRFGDVGDFPTNTNTPNVRHWGWECLLGSSGNSVGGFFPGGYDSSASGAYADGETITTFSGDLVPRTKYADFATIRIRPAIVSVYQRTIGGFTNTVYGRPSAIIGNATFTRQFTWTPEVGQSVDSFVYYPALYLEKLDTPVNPP